MSPNFPPPFANVKQKNMVGWYGPAQLLRTGLEVIVSTLFAQHSDSRRLDAIATRDAIVNFNKKVCSRITAIFGLTMLLIVAMAGIQPMRLPMH